MGLAHHIKGSQARLQLLFRDVDFVEIDWCDQLPVPNRGHFFATDAASVGLLAAAWRGRLDVGRLHDFDLEVLVALLALLSLTRVQRKARHEVGGAESVYVANQLGLQIRVVHLDALEKTFRVECSIVFIKKAVVDRVADDQEVVSQRLKKGFELVVQSLLEQEALLGQLEQPGRELPVLSRVHAHRRGAIVS